jgi:hypothetical protein
VVQYGSIGIYSKYSSLVVFAVTCPTDIAYACRCMELTFPTDIAYVWRCMAMACPKYVAYMCDLHRPKREGRGTRAADERLDVADGRTHALEGRDHSVLRLSERGRRLVQSARTAVLPVGSGGPADTSRGPQPATAELRTARGSATPPGGRWWAMRRCTHRVWAQLSASCASALSVIE